MEIEFALLADAVSQPPDGKLYILGGGLQAISAAQFPYTHPMLGLACLLRVHTTEADHQHQLEIRIAQEDGQPLGSPIQGQFGVQRHPRHPHRDVFVPIVLHFGNLVFQNAAEYQFHLLVNGHHLKTLTLSVEPLTSLPPTQYRPTSTP